MAAAISLELLADPTVMRWPAGQRWCYVAARLIAEAGPRRGALVDATGDPLSLRQIAQFLRVHPRTAEGFLQRAVRAALIDRLDDGTLVWMDLWSELGMAPSAHSVPQKCVTQWSTLDACGQPASSTRAPARARLNAGNALSVEEQLLAVETLPFPQTGDHAVADGTDDPGQELDAELARIVVQLRSGVSSRTHRMLADLQRELPPAAFYRALESLEKRRQASSREPLRNEARYFTGTLLAIRREDRRS